jgi:hypothetical protein
MEINGTLNLLNMKIFCLILKVILKVKRTANIIYSNSYFERVVLIYLKELGLQMLYDKRP